MGMLRQAMAMKELELRRRILYADLYQLCGQMTVRGLESLCRKIHHIDLKIHSIKRAYDNK